MKEAEPFTIPLADYDDLVKKLKEAEFQSITYFRGWRVQCERGNQAEALLREHQIAGADLYESVQILLELLAQQSPGVATLARDQVSPGQKAWEKAMSKNLREDPPPTPSPNPGSDEAVTQGCICPVLDNAHGKGYMGNDQGHFVITRGCPLHDGPAA